MKNRSKLWNLFFILIFLKSLLSHTSDKVMTREAWPSKVTIQNGVTCADYPPSDMLVEEGQMDQSPYTWSYHGKVKIVDDRPPCGSWHRVDANCLTVSNMTHPFRLTEPLTVIKTSYDPTGGHSCRHSGALVAAQIMITFDGTICSEVGTPQNAKWQSLKFVAKLSGLKWENLKRFSNGVLAAPPVHPFDGAVEGWLHQPFVWLVEKAVTDIAVGRLEAFVSGLYTLGLDSLKA